MQAGLPDAAPLDLDRYPSLPAMLAESFQQHALEPAFSCMGAELTYADVDALSRDFAAWLQAQGVVRGTRIAVMLPNLLAFPVVLAGILRAGCVQVSINPLYTPRELAYQLTDSGAEMIVVLEKFATTVEQVLAETAIRQVVVVSLGDLLGLRGAVVNFVARKVKKLIPPYALPQAKWFAQVLAEGRALHFQPVGIGPDDVALLQYSGGTTGVPKGAVLLHRNLVANTLQVATRIAPIWARIPASEQPVVITALPLYHITALVSCLVNLRNGDLGVLIPNPREVAALVRLLGKTRFHVLPGINTLFNALLNQPGFDQLDFSHLQLCPSGGMAVQDAVATRWLATTGCAVTEGYGMSEVCIVSLNNPLNQTHTLTAGPALPMTDIAIRDDEGNDLPAGALGEVCLRGPQVCDGYWKKPEESRLAVFADGFFRSGDIGRMTPEGCLQIVDRKKDMILVSGFNVFPNEIEAVVSAHPGVLECAVVGVPDAHSGEAVRLHVVRKDAALSEAMLREHCRTQLTGYKQPKYIVFEEALPKSNVGKILRRELRERLPV
ncbi:acyl-CoA synthetase family protein [Chitinimonas naiadis]